VSGWRFTPTSTTDRANVLLAIRDNAEMVFIARLSGRDAVPVFSYLGTPLRRCTSKTDTDPNATSDALRDALLHGLGGGTITRQPSAAPRP